MRDSDRPALGRFVMRAKEYLAIVRENGGALTLTTMRFADEIRDRDGIDTAPPEAARAEARATESGGRGDRGSVVRLGP
jgi:DNA end-binding protein Ku